MKSIIVIMVSLFLCLACQDSQEPQKPKNLISKDKMVDVLIDLSILSSAKGVNKKVIEKNGITPDEYVYKRHEIDSTIFAESNAYYSYYIDDYKHILTRVQDSLNKLRFDYNRLAEKEENKKQSKKGDRKKDLRKTRKADSLIKIPNDSE
ncbi:DUF4296 domain-containing protein [Hanstruepera flava]|uniref:DUF4296 domain-containing protein n=1 Tax=Hanstruepera flava TaxID=2930218 RepID=UPI0020292CCB|nr:DUF4296 domain-containing protein [Hanstruepera flava]